MLVIARIGRCMLLLVAIHADTTCGPKKSWPPDPYIPVFKTGDLTAKFQLRGILAEFSEPGSAIKVAVESLTYLPRYLAQICTHNMLKIKPEVKQSWAESNSTPNYVWTQEEKWTDPLFALSSFRFTFGVFKKNVNTSTLSHAGEWKNTLSKKGVWENLGRNMMYAKDVVLGLGYVVTDQHLNGGLVEFRFSVQSAETGVPKLVSVPGERNVVYNLGLKDLVLVNATDNGFIEEKNGIFVYHLSTGVKFFADYSILLVKSGNDGSTMAASMQSLKAVHNYSSTFCVHFIACTAAFFTLLTASLQL